MIATDQLLIFSWNATGSYTVTLTDPNSAVTTQTVTAPNTAGIESAGFSDLTACTQYQWVIAQSGATVLSGQTNTRASGTSAACPINSPKVDGRYLRARTR